MRRARTGSVLPFVLALVGGLLPTRGEAQRSGTEVTVRGTVLDAATGQPLPDVLVYLPYANRDVRADSAGTFMAELVPRGLLELALAREGYRTIHARLPAFQDRDVTVELHPLEDPDPPTGELRGQVVDGDTGEPVQYAMVRVLGEGTADMTDRDGRFRLRWVDEGEAIMAVSHIGYQARIVPEKAVADSTRTLYLPLATRPIPLAGIDVSVQNKWLAIGGFYMRQGRGYRGKQWGPEELARLDPGSLNDVLREERTLGVHWMGGVEGWQGYRDCDMDIWLDGVNIGDNFSLDMIDPERIAAMEVFTGPFQTMPPGIGCGAILLWQKKGS